MASLCPTAPPPAIGSSLKDLGDRYLTDLNAAARNQVFRLGTLVAWQSTEWQCSSKREFHAPVAVTRWRLEGIGWLP